MTPVRHSPILPIQQALYERLTGDTVLSGMVTGVFDFVPEGTARDYVVIGDAVDTPSNTAEQYGSETVITVNVWSEYRGFAVPLTVEARIVELLDHQPLTVAGHTVIAVRHEQTMPMRDPDPRIRHISVRLRVVTEQEM